MDLDLLLPTQTDENAEEELSRLRRELAAERLKTRGLHRSLEQMIRRDREGLDEKLEMQRRIAAAHECLAWYADQENWKSPPIRQDSPGVLTFDPSRISCTTYRVAQMGIEALAYDPGLQKYSTPFGQKEICKIIREKNIAEAEVNDLRIRNRDLEMDLDEAMSALGNRQGTIPGEAE